MILYLDTSSLMKLYVEEPGSEAVSEWVDSADLVVTCRVALPEALSAFRRRFNRSELSEADFDSIVTAIERDWPQYFRLDFDERVAGALVAKHSLRGFDAIHLSSAMRMTDGPEPIEVNFSSADRKLNRAAQAEGLTILDAAAQLQP